MIERKQMTAVLLSGGKSSRMGYHPKQNLLLDGESFKQRILRQFQGFGEIAISVENGNEKEKSDWPETEESAAYPVWRDRFSNLGPLGGLEVCLERAAYDVVLLVACDYPMMSSGCMDFLIGQMEEEDDCVVPVVDGRIHPVCAIYRKRICPVVEEQIKNGELAMKSLLKKLQVHDVDMPEVYGECFRNVNTPEEYEKLKKDGNTQEIPVAENSEIV